MVAIGAGPAHAHYRPTKYLTNNNSDWDTRVKILLKFWHKDIETDFRIGSKKETWSFPSLPCSSLGCHVSCTRSGAEATWMRSQNTWRPKKWRRRGCVYWGSWWLKNGSGGKGTACRLQCALRPRKRDGDGRVMQRRRWLLWLGGWLHWGN